MLISIGGIRLYTEKTVAEALGSDDSIALSTSMPESLTLAEIFPISAPLWLNDPGVSIDHYVDGRASASFAVRDDAGTMAYYERMRVDIRDLDNVPYFSGLIQSCEEVKIPGCAVKFHSVDATDFTAMLDWRVVDYAAQNKLAGGAVREIITEYLAEEGITVGYIEDGVVLTEISLGDVPATVAIQKLADSQGFVFYLDYDLKLYFHTRTLYAADWSITDLEDDVLNESFSMVHTNPDYRNTEIGKGGFAETDLMTDTFIGDGTTKTFPLAYPVNRISTVTVAGTAKTVGQKGTDTGYDSYYALQSETFTFEVAPANAAAIIISYYGLWKAKSKAEDLSAIAANAARQGVGSGKVEHITTDDSLTSIASMGEYLNATLANYALDGVTVKYRTRKSGLAAGTLQHIHLSDMAAGLDFLITNVNESHKDGDAEYSVSGCYGPVQAEWALFLNTLFQPTQSSVSEGVDASGVTKLYNFSHTYLDADRTPTHSHSDIFTHAPLGAGLAVSSDTWPCFAPLDRVEYIELWRGGACIFRKLHTSVVDEELETDIHSYSYIAAAEAIGAIDEAVFWGGSMATVVYGTGVEIYRTAFVKTKSVLESYQLNMNYINGSV
jgi:hypothetical protein